MNGKVEVTWAAGDKSIMSAACFHILMSTKSGLCCQRRIIAVRAIE